MKKINYNCAICGNPILSPNAHKRYCSDECAKAANRERARIQFRKRYAEKREEELARNRLYYSQHKEQKKASATQWRTANREYYNAQCREWYRKKKAVSQ